MSTGGSFFAGSAAPASNALTPADGLPAAVVDDVQAVNAAVSKRHSNVELGSLEETVNVGVASLVGPDGPVTIVVCGGVVSTVNDRVAGTGSVLSGGSIARTSNVCSTAHSAVGSMVVVRACAVAGKAAGLTGCPTHPPGGPEPAGEDVLFTRTRVEAGKGPGIEVLDHLILGTNRLVSLKQRGMM